MDVIPISALNHFSYCPRRAALIYVDNIFAENVFTLKGESEHEKTHEGGASECDGEGHVERALPVWSDTLGLTGKADTIEFRADGTIYPVEYKHGRKNAWERDEIQLCAQALCLEEMFKRSVQRGALFFFSSRRRREVAFSEPLRARTRRTVEQVRALLREKNLPPPPNDARCRNCSLIEACMPDVLWERGRVSWFLSNLYRPREGGHEGS